MMEPQVEPRQEPRAEDIGTRLDHLRDYMEALEICIETLKDRDSGSKDEKRKILELSVAAKVLRATIDAHTGYNETTTEYMLYRLLNNIPKAEEIEGGRGTPLA